MCILFLWTNYFISLRQIPLRCIADSYSKYMFNRVHMEILSKCNFPAISPDMWWESEFAAFFQPLIQANSYKDRSSNIL